MTETRRLYSLAGQAVTQCRGLGLVLPHEFVEVVDPEVSLTRPLYVLQSAVVRRASHRRARSGQSHFNWFDKSMPKLQ